MATGLVTVVSENDVPTTIARLAEAAEGAGLRVFGIVDHQAGASSVGRRLRPTSLIVLGKWDSDRKRSEERRVGKECRSRWSPYH